MGHKYWNRSEELKRLIQVLRSQGIFGIEELNVLLAQTIQGYAAQLQIEPLRPRELEYVWIKLLD
jgi:hypothetical protein